MFMMLSQNIAQIIYLLIRLIAQVSLQSFLKVTMDVIFRIDEGRPFHNCGAATANERPPYALSLYDWGTRRLSLFDRNARDGLY